jgi:hypothetical protein
MEGGGLPKIRMREFNSAGERRQGVTGGLSARFGHLSANYLLKLHVIVTAPPSCAFRRSGTECLRSP